VTLREAANQAVELEQEVIEATIEQTGDAPDPSYMAFMSAALSTLADGDVEGAAEMLVNLQRMIRDDELELLR
jgi:hypothetical protein